MWCARLRTRRDRATASRDRGEPGASQGRGRWQTRDAADQTASGKRRRWLRDSERGVAVRWRTTTATLCDEKCGTRETSRTRYHAMKCNVIGEVVRRDLVKRTCGHYRRNRRSRTFSTRAGRKDSRRAPTTAMKSRLSQGPTTRGPPPHDSAGAAPNEVTSARMTNGDVTSRAPSSLTNLLNSSRS